jgi:LmbE family N-acetylglucosaminyl deacetylase
MTGGQGDLDLIYRLRGLVMGGAVLHLGAHPDDEDTGTLAYLSRGMSVETVYWSATRGEGGQNRIGRESGEALGILRTWESLAAREIDGGSVLYGPFYDFGFSKKGEDALDRWGREDVVREIVRAIRRVQPHVVISRWSGGAQDGHGQHQAIGMAAGDAFDAAAEPHRFPELDRQGLPPWRPRKLYRSLGRDWQPGEDVVFGTPSAEHEAQGALRVNTGVLDPICGLSFQEQAAIAQNRHRSQAMAFLPERGDFFYYYRLERGPAPEGREASFFDGLDPTLAGIAVEEVSGRLTKVLSEARDHAGEAVRLFRPEDQIAAGTEVLHGLARLREARRILADEELEEWRRRALLRYLDRRIDRFEGVAALCLGIALDCLVEESRVTGDQRVRVGARLWNRGPEQIGDPAFGLRVPEGWSVQGVEPPDRRAEESASVVEAAFDVEIPEAAELSSPYWLRTPRSVYRYEWPERGSLGLPFDQPLLEATAELRVGGQPLTLSAAATYRETFAGGFRELPLAVLPPIALSPREERLVIPATDAVHRLQLHLTARCMRRGGAAGTLEIEVSDDWAIHPQSADLSFSARGESRTLTFELVIPSEARPGEYGLRYSVDAGTARYGVALNPVWLAAPGLPGPADESNALAETFVMLPAAVSVNLVAADFIPTLRYGYITGVDERILPSLERFGVNVQVLSEVDLTYGDLGSFDAVVVGPNAYLLRSDVRKAAPRLLEYVEQGGTLVVQFQGYGYQDGGFAPYPFRFRQPHDRVTLPDAPITFLKPGHPTLHVPNEITEADFRGWVHDRGLYFFGEWDHRYIPVLASNDPGETSKAGGLLVASYGRGTYVYCGYSLYRQIPVGVPGAVRLFANLLGLAEARIQERRELARTVPLFSFMTDEQLYQVARLMSERWIEDRAYLCRQGDWGGELYLVLDGEVEVIKQQDGKELVVYTTRPGEATGDLSVLTDLPRSASLRARGDARVLVMRGEQFRVMLRQHPDLAEGVIRTLAQRLATNEERLLSGLRSD